MKKKLLLFLALAVTGVMARSQNSEETNFNMNRRATEPFLFSLSTLTPEDLKWSIDYSGSYGERIVGPMGFDGVSQQFGIKGYLGKRFTVYANASIGFPGKSNTTTAQQAELIRNFLGGKKALGLRFGAGLGVRNDFSNVTSLLGRATLSFETLRLKTTGNMLFEKALASNRDAIDIITSLGIHYQLVGELYGGLEAIGEDLEGFWEEEEAEGGAKLLVGPSFNLVPKQNRFSFSLSGGPVFYSTKNQQSNPEAIRELPNQSGLMVRSSEIYNLS
jgi:hypothetical protein